jgi:hypothetical protein
LPFERRHWLVLTKLEQHATKKQETIGERLCFVGPLLATPTIVESKLVQHIQSKLIIDNKTAAIRNRVD